MTLSFYPQKDFLMYSFLLRRGNLISDHPKPMYFKTSFHVHVAVVKFARLDHGDNRTKGRIGEHCLCRSFSQCGACFR